MWGKAIIEKGSRWSIRNGEDTCVIKDRWIPREHNFSLEDPHPIPDNMRVAELKNYNGTWNEAVR
jgi:hypothetical protein